jgi:hypothetical protein
MSARKANRFAKIVRHRRAPIRYQETRMVRIFALLRRDCRNYV